MDNNFKIFTQSASETEKLGEKLANNLSHGQVVCLYGELGSGKTTFSRGFARGLGIKQRILSPTFIIVRSYAVIVSPPNRRAKQSRFYHLDLYRLEKLEDTKSLGLEEIFSNPKNIIIIEWPEIIKEILPKKRIEIYFKYLSENERKIRWTTT